MLGGLTPGNVQVSLSAGRGYFPTGHSSSLWCTLRQHIFSSSILHSLSFSLGNARRYSQETFNHVYSKSWLTVHPRAASSRVLSSTSLTQFPKILVCSVIYVKKAWKDGCSVLDKIIVIFGRKSLRLRSLMRMKYIRYYY